MRMRRSSTPDDAGAGVVGPARVGRSPVSKLGAVLAVATLVAALWSFQPSAMAHNPPANNDWNCFADTNANCWYHWPNATRGWHFSGTVPTDVRNNVRGARNTITAGHVLSAPEDGSAPSHVYWRGTVCNVACMIPVTLDGPNDHILTFELNFDDNLSPLPVDWWFYPFIAHGYMDDLDFLQVSTHEFGHAAGLGHSQRDAGHDCEVATTTNEDNNWATMTQGVCLLGGHLEQRTLHQVDIDGRCDIYNHAHGWSC